MIYFIQVNIYAALMYGIYLFFLRNNTQHNFNRVYLLLCAVLPLIIPFIKVHAISSALSGNNPVSSVVLPAINISSHPAEQQGSVKLVRNTGIGPGSWSNYIFLSGNDADASVIAHEQAHIRLRHSVDVLFIRLLQCLFWPDIILIAIIKELKVVHEFQADAYSASNKEQYISTILNEVFGTKSFSLSHTFFHHPVKRRIMMLQKSGKSRLVYLLAPVICIALFSTIVVAQSTRPTPLQNVSDKTQNDSDKVYTFVKKMPEAGYDFNGFLAENLKYPDSARVKNIQGRVIARFVVDEQGNIVNPVILHSPDSSLSTAALDVINKMPKWTPGEIDGKKVAVYFTLPISFRLESH